MALKMDTIFLSEGPGSLEKPRMGRCTCPCSVPVLRATNMEGQVTDPRQGSFVAAIGGDLVSPSCRMAISAD
jgi:hypothetical protein